MLGYLKCRVEVDVESQVKPFEALKVKLSRYMKRREAIAAATVTPIFKKAQEEEGST